MESIPAPPRETLPTDALFKRLREASLYTKVELAGETPNRQLRSLRLYAGKFDSYCPSCEKESTFATVVSAELVTRNKQENAAVMGPGNRGSAITHFWDADFTLITQCTRKGHPAKFHFTVDGPAIPSEREPGPTCVVKTGQYPSLTDFQMGATQDFYGAMTRQQRREFTRAINGAAHGMNVAACVYFRRVFEIELRAARDAYMQAHALADWPEFRDARTRERIPMVANYLPPFMRDNPKLYGILSLGVHEMSEEECGEQLPTLRSAIELIFRDKLAAQKAAEQRADTAKLLAKFESPNSTA